MKNMTEKDLFRLAIISSLTLGLAPFFPHAHIWKQLMNLYHGRTMLGMDWIDLAMHGAPWILLITLSVRRLIKQFKK
jgi:hypothetical protein